MVMMISLSRASGASPGYSGKHSCRSARRLFAIWRCIEPGSRRPRKTHSAFNRQRSDGIMRPDAPVAQLDRAEAF